MSIFNFFTGAGGFILVRVLNLRDETQQAKIWFHELFLWTPHYALSSAFGNINTIYNLRRMCRMLTSGCRKYVIGATWQQCRQHTCGLQQHCCDIPSSYFDWAYPGLGKNVCYPFVVAVISIVIIGVIEYEVFEKFTSKKLTWLENEGEEEADVGLENQTVRSTSLLHLQNHPLVLRNLAKHYGKLFVVKNVCLRVNKMECFGLLGVNGAGKSTILKMLTKDEAISSGDAWLNGKSFKDNKTRNLVGYCPQTDALLEELTCRETIIMFCMIKGFNRKNTTRLAIKLAEEFYLQNYLDVQVRNLSSGNKRKLSTAIAMIGDPSVVYLDEPSTGMDPVSKRCIWNKLCELRNSGRCIVLTSHSMEECEALCTRLVIMIDGKFKCLGSIEHLNNKYSTGYNLTVKMAKKENQDLLATVQMFIEENFPGSFLSEARQDLATFTICQDSAPLSKMFGVLENEKEALNIEDYFLGQSTLETIFLWFARNESSKKEC